MRKAVLVLLLVLYTSISVTLGVPPVNPDCEGLTLHDVRIEGCEEQPCNIRKGVNLPFELDLSFEQPAGSANDVYFNIWVSYYGPPPGAFGSYLSTAHCENGGLGFECPARANQTYTLKNAVFIDESYICAAGCDEMNEDGTGVRGTDWSLTISNRLGSKPNKGNSISATSYCFFRVALNITW